MFFSRTVTCRESEFQCETGFGCLDASLLCSGVPQCLDLSDEVLKKVYYKNALRIVPGIDKSKFTE